MDGSSTTGVAYPGYNLHPQGPQPTPAQEPFHGYLATLEASDSSHYPPFTAIAIVPGHGWPHSPCLHVPPIFLPSKPTPNQQMEDPAKSLPCPDEAAAPLLLGLGGYGVTAGPWQAQSPAAPGQWSCTTFMVF